MNKQNETHPSIEKIIVFLNENTKPERIQDDALTLVKARWHMRHLASVGYSRINSSEAKTGKQILFIFENGEITTAAESQARGMRS